MTSTRGLPYRLRLALEGAALGAALGVVDYAAHAEAGSGFTLRTAAAACLFLVVAYALVASLVALAVGRRKLTAWLLLMAFAPGQLGLMAYRTGFQEDLVPSSIALAAMVALVALAAGLLVKRFLASHPGKTRGPAAVLAGVAVAAMVAWLLPAPPAAPLAAFPPEPTGRGSVHRPNLLLITLDTVRPDHLPAYGYRGIRTPALDRVAREGVVFDDAVSQAPITPVSHASLLTGLTPAVHGLRNFDRENRLREGVPTLAQMLSAQGYETGAVVAASTLDPVFGLDRGFDTYRLVLPPSFYPFRTAGRSLMATVLAQTGLVQRRGADRPATPQIDDAVAWLERFRGSTFFLWLHLFDAHEPYTPPSFATRPEHHPGEMARPRRVFLYDSEIVGMDHALARLLDRLDSLGLSRDTLVVVASDHGDGLGDHGYYGHTGRLYREQTRIVLLLRWPGHLPAATRVASQVRAIDVLPTVLGLLGAPCPPVQGTDLRPWIAGAAEGDLPAYSETLEPEAPSRQLAAYDDGRLKLIRTLTGHAWLFDRQADPGEHRALALVRQTTVPRLGTQLDALLDGGSAVPARAEEIDPDLRERLGSLGYLD